MLLKVRPEEFRYWHRYVERTKRRAMVMGIQTFNRLTGNILDFILILTTQSCLSDVHT